MGEALRAAGIFVAGAGLESPQTEPPLTDSLEVKSMNNIDNNKKKLAPEQREELLRVLKARFEKNMNRHKGFEWEKVQDKLQANTEKLSSLNQMEKNRR